MISPGSVQFVYFSGGGKDILGYSQPISVRWKINISPRSDFTTNITPGADSSALLLRSWPQRLQRESCSGEFSIRIVLIISSCNCDIME